MMSDRRDEQPLNRRTVLKGALAGLAALPGIAVMERAAAQAAPVRLDEKDAAAVALGYIHDATKVEAAKNPTYKAGQNCANCLQIQGKAGEAWRGCNLFPGKQVNANGWCRVWVQKPA
jgi:High potential iron-sulfur protein